MSTTPWKNRGGPTREVGRLRSRAVRLLSSSTSPVADIEIIEESSRAARQAERDVDRQRAESREQRESAKRQAESERQRCA